VNSAGIMITETTITGFTSFDPAGTPEFYRARKALQYSNSIDDYARIMLDGNNGGYANDWLLNDNKTGEIAMFEPSLKRNRLRRAIAARNSRVGLGKVLSGRHGASKSRGRTHGRKDAILGRDGSSLRK